MTTEATAPESGTTTAAPAASPAPAAPESLLHTPAPAPAADAAATTDEYGWMPEKYRVTGADGKIDLAASSKKLGEGYGALSQKLGQAPAVPAAATDYTYEVPEQFKEVPMDETMSAAFRERAHKAGFSQEQYKFVMDEYLSLVPEMLNSAASQTADKARTALQQVWSDPTDYARNIGQAQKAIQGLPPALQDEALNAGLGANPAFIKIMASLGKEMGEDRPIMRTPTGVQGADVDALMASDAYRNAGHPQHKAVSAQVRAFFEQHPQ